MVVLIEGPHFMRYFEMKAHCYTHIDECGSIEGDVLIEESDLNEVVRYIHFCLSDLILK